MTFYADIHVHSKYSRATSRDCDLEHLSIWGRRKGISVVGTGDFTHPAWRQELREKLVPDKPGLYRLRPELERAAVQELEPSCRGDTRFMLTVEISTIYKKGEKTRKVHHVICAPDFEHVDRLVERLTKIGNLVSDGRPILGLDSRDLLEITLEAGDGAYLIPAHIWTPWFSALGSKSGFDSIAECYGDLSDHIFAVETGLSSDPPMNWRLSSLDRYRLVSHSDAHSPAKLGREACVFDCGVDYFAMRRALETGQGYGGTVEFFPEEGKYHLDGHRKCQVFLTPAETRRYDGRCPACGKPVTVGVMHRVEALADREEGCAPEAAGAFRSLVPLPEVIAELEQVGAQSKRVAARYAGLTARLGPELFILEQAPLDEVRRQGSELLAEAIRRMRAGQVIRRAGYDGEYGVIRVFEPDELQRQRGAGFLFAPDQLTAPVPKSPTPAVAAESPPPLDGPQARVGADRGPAFSTGQSRHERRRTGSVLDGLDPDQRAAAEMTQGPLLIIAGPGTGKTRTLTHRLAHLVGEQGAAPAQCLAITFTRRAAGEMRERLAALLPGGSENLPVHTFHSLGLDILREQSARAGLPRDFTVAGEAEQEAVLGEALGLKGKRLRQVRERLSAHKRGGAVPPAHDALDEQHAAYAQALRKRGQVDFEDLLALPVQLLEEDPALVAEYRRRYRWLSIDEYQDIDPLQYRLVRLLVAADGNLCAIGDPNQAIYGFRGADVGLFHRFREDFPSAQVVRLSRCYRLGRTLLDASAQVIAGPDPDEARLEALIDSPGAIVLHEAATERAEAEFVVQSLERLLGGHTFFSLDSGRSSGDAELDLTFGDIAVLYRLEAQADALSEALARSGIPFQRRSHHRLSERPLVRELVALLRALPDQGTLRERLQRAAAQHLGSAEGGPDPGIGSQVAAAVAELEPLALQHGDDASGFVDALALGAESDLWDPRAERISLLTLHAAKGLEFRAVFVVGCEDGLLPLSFGGRVEGAQLEEERRLFYVGMTRAIDRLFLCRARKRRRYGKVTESRPSPFLRDIEERLLERRAASGRGKRRDKAPPQLDLF